ncbi:hypothetical protein [Hyphobacterium sp.]|uniref:hypothetical protein n=1 Tax=Hyphobacterium sp. TaxID=2004662 RepID=UPI003BAB29AE
MKKMLTMTTAALALAATGCTTAAMATQRSASAPEDGSFEIIVTRQSGDDQAIVIRGVEVEIVDGDVIVDGDAIRVMEDGRIFISGDQADVLTWVHNGDVAFSEADHALRLVAIESQLAAELDRLEDVHVIIDDMRIEGLEEAMAELESELGQLESRRMVIVNGERRELTDQERAEVREELEEAREEIRESIEDVRRELAEGRAGRREALRDMQIVIANSRDEMMNAEREARLVRRNANHHHVRIDDITRRLRDAGANRIRIETVDGEDRVWVDGEEVEGDERTEWLNRLEIERLEGSRNSRRIIWEMTDEE